jgi:hypothetical protein
MFLRLDLSHPVKLLSYYTGFEERAELRSRSDMNKHKISS